MRYDGFGVMARRKEFEPKQALRDAMYVFWEKGYEATTIGDLVEHTGINRASLYAQCFELPAVPWHVNYLGPIDAQYRCECLPPISCILVGLLLATLRAWSLECELQSRIADPRLGLLSQCTEQHSQR